ncbi:MAG: putative toxin-antitoxin system toxin component, PIN family [Catonella sp.]|uniref:putative toxin-antitoxin system toxin component, PIN family n=1 Tax=Catonella sp. TaxID=2382125 RepID=UPI003F9FD23F
MLNPFITKLELIEPVTHTDICRDPDDNKFLSCAYDTKALYIVSGDKDLLLYAKYTLFLICQVRILSSKMTFFVLVIFKNYIKISIVI